MDVTALAGQVIHAARARGVMIATAESCTGGLVAGALTAVPGASDVLDRGFVTYSNAAKQDMLGVRAETLERYGAVSEPVALEMASGACAASLAGLAVSITGIAGPGGSEHKPEGRVCFAMAGPGPGPSPAGARAGTVEFGPLGRDRVRAASVKHALELLLAALAQT
ncbi:MAG: CinA family protein [Paracoccus sp. (in: a-proteobacteria)]|nr:CinA family protein [Paracoccus sp. (in: a-proteobacteria)]